MYNLPMSSLNNFLSGTRVLEEAESSINGEIKVVRDLAWGTHVVVEGLTQSGGIARDVWKLPLKKIKTKEIKDCLILGLGAGGIVSLVKKQWPGVKITGVEIDPVMVKLGKKYFRLGGVDIEVGDAKEYVEKNEGKVKFDLILVDTYLGNNYPRELESKRYLMGIKKLVTKEGIVVFNRLYSGKNRSLAAKFLKKIEDVFPEVEATYPEANVMYVCSTS